MNYTLTPLPNSLENVEGFYCDATNVGMRPDPEQGDLAFIRSEIPCDIASVFTTNRFPAAPIKHYRQYPEDFQTNFVLMNAKNANAMTGKEGIEDIETILEALGEHTDVLNPVMSSTGVIGYRLPVEKIISGFEKLDFYAKNSDKTARAIMTTDKFKKELAYRVTLESGESFTIAAICKGAGMINPAMATMLCFIITDADIPKEEMYPLLKSGADFSFNRISVDGDTSTNDTVMLLTNRQSAVYRPDAFKAVLEKIMFELAMMILKDGEGATKVVAFTVKGAVTTEEAERAATALSNSLLVKTALFGEDPNWGRIASTIGASGIHCDEDLLKIYYDDLLIYSDEQRELDKEREEEAYRIMKQEQFTITCDLGLGEESFTAYGCDLSYDYVKINAEYRT
jgi:glutamate N-acetyltransferase/amino-acid N-acetyltransferase